MSRKPKYPLKAMTGGVADSILELKKDTEAFKWLSELEELIEVPPERGGLYFSDWEKQFVRSVRAQFDEAPIFSAAQRDKLKQVWQAADLRKRSRNIEHESPAQNLFSSLSPARQAEQRARAASVKLPWEK